MPVAERLSGPLVIGGGWLLAIALAAMISRGQWVALIGFGAVGAAIAVSLLGTRSLLFIVTVAAFLQPPLGNAGGIPQVTLAEVFVPLLLIVLLLRSSGVRVADEASRNPLVLRSEASARSINAMILIFTTVVVLNLFRTKILFQDVAPGVNRAFYDYAIALGIYLLAYVTLTRQQLTFQGLFRILFLLALVMSIIGVTAVALNLPLNLGSLRYSVYDYGTGAKRVGFLETFGTVGLALTLVRPMRFRWAAGGLFAAALILSGGRAATIGMLVALCTYLLITRRAVRLVIAVGIVVVTLVTVPVILKNSQLQRLTQVNEKALASAQRSFIYRQSLHEFARHPVAGTGIGRPENVTDPLPFLAKFYDAQLEVGGHATYAALLKNLGLIGFIPFIVALFTALTGLARLVRTSDVAGFLFIVLAAQVVSLFAGGNGSDPVYYFVLGAAAAALARAARLQLEPAPETPDGSVVSPAFGREATQT
jgi:multisubunit Na+/H+ antiporter MnhC subunit